MRCNAMQWDPVIQIGKSGTVTCGLLKGFVLAPLGIHANAIVGLVASVVVGGRRTAQPPWLLLVC